MLCLSGFELYSRWVPLIHPAYFSLCLSLSSFQFQHAPCHLQQRLVIYCYSLLEFFRCYLCRQIYHIISIQNINKNALTAATYLACLETGSRNEEAINSTRNMIYSLKVFYFLLYRRRYFLFVSELI